MDLVEQNYATMAIVRLHNMTLDEIVQADRGLGMKFHFSGQMWWRQVKPFFYQPAAATIRVNPHDCCPNPLLALGGYYHMVPEGAESNGVIVANEISDPAGYDVQSLKRKRNQVLRALATFRIQPVTSLDDLLTSGFQVYLDWERRTNNLGAKRSNTGVFRRWAVSILAHPYSLLLGAYAGNRLAAFMTIYAADGVASCSKIFSHSEFNQITPSSGMLYTFVKIASNNPEIRRVW